MQLEGEFIMAYSWNDIWKNGQVVGWMQFQVKRLESKQMHSYTRASISGEKIVRFFASKCFFWNIKLESNDIENWVLKFEFLQWNDN